MLGVKETKIEHYQKRCIDIMKEWIKTIKALNEP
jgi:hypothetical protein